ncbi:hypothetical protein QUA20_29555 [Microcoleus sp. Pol7_A1]|uniref:hypothetical protein n=1 Tax=Microcoleus sp. Pol7_A1 TaxID=2818893 RepID=UPI002FD3D07E
MSSVSISLAVMFSSVKRVTQGFLVSSAGRAGGYFSDGRVLIVVAKKIMAASRKNSAGGFSRMLFSGDGASRIVATKSARGEMSNRTETYAQELISRFEY